MFRKGLINDIGVFKEDLKQLLDYEYFYRILKSNKIALLEEKLVSFRLHGRQTTVINKNNDVFGEDHAKFHRIIYDNYLRYLDPYHKKVFLRRYNPFVRLYFNVLDVIKRIIKRNG